MSQQITSQYFKQAEQVSDFARAVKSEDFTAVLKPTMLHTTRRRTTKFFMFAEKILCESTL